MKFYEEQIQKFAHGAKKSQKSSDPALLNSNKLLYELEKERMEAQLHVWQTGKPSVEGVNHFGRFFRSMGFEPYSFPGVVDHATGYDEYKAIIERLGFPEKCCERTVAQLAMCEIGDLPKPSIVLNDAHGCDADKFNRRSLPDWFNIPVFFIDVPLNTDDKPNLASLNYIADQLGDFIEWAEEKVPGIKYNKDKHIELMEIDAIGEKYRLEIYQLIKHVPSPIAPQDVFRRRIMMFEPSRYPNTQKGIEFLRTCRDELGERVASGKGPYPEERLRLLWAGQSHELQAYSPYKMLMERRVAIPLVLVGGVPRLIGMRCPPIGEVSEYGVKLSLLQEEARTLDSSYWGGPGKRWVNGTLEAARDIGAHGIIHFLLIGCTPMRGMGSEVAERAEKELGIPTLNVEGRQIDRAYMSQGQFEEILLPFIDKCFDRAGKPRQ